MKQFDIVKKTKKVLPKPSQIEVPKPPPILKVPVLPKKKNKFGKYILTIILVILAIGFVFVFSKAKSIIDSASSATKNATSQNQILDRSE